MQPEKHEFPFWGLMLVFDQENTTCGREITKFDRKKQISWNSALVDPDFRITKTPRNTTAREIKPREPRKLIGCSKNPNPEHPRPRNGRHSTTLAIYQAKNDARSHRKPLEPVLTPKKHIGKSKNKENTTNPENQHVPVFFMPKKEKRMRKIL